MDNIKELYSDPEFLALDKSDQHKILKNNDPEYKALSPSAQKEIILSLPAATFDRENNRNDIVGDPRANKGDGIVVGTFGGAPRAVQPVDDTELRNLTAEQKMKDAVHTWLYKLSEAALPVLGMTGAEVVGSPLTAASGPYAPATAAALGTGGYAAGMGLHRAFFPKKGETPMDALKNIVGDVGTGAAMQAIGAGIPAAAGWAATKLRPIMPKLTSGQVERAAGDVYNKLSRVPKGYEANAAEADAIEQSIPGLKFDPAQRTGAPSVISEFNSLQRQTPTAQDVLYQGKAQQTQALKDYLDSHIAGGGSIDDIYQALEAQKGNLENAVQAARVTPPSGSAPYDAGKDIVQAVEAKAAPVKAAAEELYAKIPVDYQMSGKNFRDAYRKIQNAPDVPATVADRIKSVLDRDKYASLLSDGKTTVGNMRAVKSELKSLESEYINKGDKQSARYIQQLRGGYKKDFAEFGESARTGNLVEINGQLVNPAALGDELAANHVKIAELKSKTAPPEIDYAEIVKRIEERGGRPSVPGVNFKQQSANEANLADYKRRFGKDAEIPMTTPVGDGNNKLIANYEARNEVIRDQLANAGTPVDAEATQLAADTFYKKHYADKFKRGDMAQIQRAGNEASGLRMEYEKMPQRFTNVSGAKELKNALGDQPAADLMRQHYQYEFSKQFERDPSKLNNWLNTNKEGLKEYGLLQEFGSLANRQKLYDDAVKAAGDYEKSTAGKILGTDDVTKTISIAAQSASPKKAFGELMALTNGNQAAQNGIRNEFKDYLMQRMANKGRDVTGDNILSDAKAQEVLAQYRSTMETLYSKQEMAAFDNVAKAIEITQRGRTRVVGEGSATAQNYIADKVKVIGGAVTGVTGRIAMAFGKVAGIIGRDEMNALALEAATNPAAAKRIQDAVAKGSFSAKWVNKLLVNPKAQATWKGLLNSDRTKDEE